MTNSVTGQPFGDGYVYANPACDCSGFEALVNPDGSWSMQVDAGLYASIYYYPDNWSAAALTIASDVTFSGGSQTYHSTFAAAKITGHVLDMASGGLPSFYVYAWDTASTTAGFASSGSDGSYEMLVPPTTYRIRFYNPYFGATGDKWWTGGAAGTSYATAADVAVTTDRSGIDMSFAASRITGTVYTASAQPASGELSVTAESGTCTGSTVGYTTTVDGTYLLVVPDGTARVSALLTSASKRYYGVAGSVTTCASATDITATGGATVSGKHITLPLYTLSGSITTQGTGAPVQDASITACFSWGCASGGTDASGAYALTVDTGTATYLYVSPPTARWQSLYQNPAGFSVLGDTTHDATLVPQYKIAGTVRRASDNTAVADTWVSVNTAGCGYVMGDYTDATGYYEIYVVSGTYRVSYEAPELQTRWTGNAADCASATDLVIGTSDPAVQDVTLPQGAIGASLYNQVAPIGLRLQRAMTFEFPETGSTKTLTITSSNSAVIPDQTFTVDSGYSSWDLDLVAGTTIGTATLTVSMTGYTPYSFALTTAQPQLQWDGPTELAWSSGGPVSGTSSFRWELYTPGCGTCDSFATGGTITAFIESRSPSTIMPGPYTLTASTVVGDSSTPDMQLPAPTAQGSFVVRGVLSGFADSAQTVTVIEPKITFNDTVVAIGFNRYVNYSIIPFTNSCPTASVTPGTGDVTFAIQSSYYGCGTNVLLTGIAVGTATVQIDLAGYTSAVATITVETPTFFMLSSTDACPDGGRCDGSATASASSTLTFSVGAKTSVGWTDWSYSGPTVTLTVISGPASFSAPTTGSTTTVTYPRSGSPYQSNDATLAFSGTGSIVVRASAAGFSSRDFVITVGP